MKKIPVLSRAKARRTAVQAGCFLALVLTLFVTLAAEQYGRVSAAVRADTLRLHILANSDAIPDQLLKLKVRDAVLAELGPLLQNAADKAEAQARLQAALPQLQAVAQRVSGQAVAVSLASAPFAARDYGSFALPAGVYTALRIELGAGQGHNWFCVLYPGLCLPGAEAQYPTAQENALVFGKYCIRFALWDFLTGAQ